MATGDLKNNLKQFQSQVKAIKYPDGLDLEGLKNGSPRAYLPLYHYLFTSYSNKFNKDIVNSNNELYGKSDLRFMEAVYKIMRNMFSHKPAITREQFFATGFTERKLIMATEIFRIIHSHYKPQKNNSHYKLAATVEKSPLESAPLVHQEQEFSVEPTKPRKVAPRASSNMSGAVVLPRSFIESSNIKTSHKVAMPLSSADSSSERISVTPRLQQSIPEKREHSDQISDTPPSMTSEMTKKMADQLTHSVIFLNEKIGKMALAIQNQEQRIDAKLLNKQEAVEESHVSNTLMTNLGKQMNDIVFKLETLSSKVVLLENRMMMMEAKVDDTQSLCRTIIATRNRPQAQNDVLSMTDAWMSKNFASRKMLEDDSGNGKGNEMAMRRNQEHKNASPRQQTVCQVPLREQTKQPENHGETLIHSVTDDNQENNHNQEEDDNIIDVIGVEPAEIAAANTNMAFMKSLMEPCSNMTLEDSTLTTTQNNCIEDQSQVKKSSKEQVMDQNTHQIKEVKSTSKDPLTGTFCEFFSPIRSFSDISTQKINTGFQDSSAISIPYVTDEEIDERRFSTPNKVLLDTSTLSRVDRITQMLTETEQLFK